MQGRTSVAGGVVLPLPPAARRSAVDSRPGLFASAAACTTVNPRCAALAGVHAQLGDRARLVDGPAASNTAVQHSKQLEHTMWIARNVRAAKTSCERSVHPAVV